MDIEALIAEARTWEGTPWMHNQCLKGHGVDCVRFLAALYESQTGVKLELGAYKRVPRANELCDYLDAIPELESSYFIRPGSVLIFRQGSRVGHVGLATTTNRFIHADNHPKVGRVVEIYRDGYKPKVEAIYNWLP